MAIPLPILYLSCGPDTPASVGGVEHDSLRLP